MGIALIFVLEHLDMAAFNRFSSFGRDALDKASSSLEASGASSYLNQAGAAASSAASAAGAAADAVLPDEVTSIAGEIGSAVAGRVKGMKDMFVSDGFREFLKNPSPEELLLHPEYLLNSIKLASIVKSPTGGALSLLTGGVADVSKAHIHKAAANQAGAQVSEATGGIVPASVVGNMSPSEMSQALKLMANSAPSSESINQTSPNVTKRQPNTPPK